MLNCFFVFYELSLVSSRIYGTSCATSTQYLRNAFRNSNNLLFIFLNFVFQLKFSIGTTQILNRCVQLLKIEKDDLKVINKFKLSFFV
jgi:hypothetical protein